jgi:hypothetical protein
MSESVKVAGIIASAIGCTVCAVCGVALGSEILMDIGYAFGAVFGSFYGFPIAGKAIAKLVK